MDATQPVKLPVTMTRTKHYTMIMSAEIRSALEDHCKAAGVSVSDFIRTSICQRLGQPELLDTMRPAHRPKAEQAPPCPEEAAEEVRHFGRNTSAVTPAPRSADSARTSPAAPASPVSSGRQTIEFSHSAHCRPNLAAE